MGRGRHYGGQSRLHHEPRQPDRLQRSLLRRAKEMLAVKASNSATTPADLKGKRLSAAKGSTSELSINLNGSRARHLPGHRLGLHGRATE